MARPRKPQRAGFGGLALRGFLSGLGLGVFGGRVGAFLVRLDIAAVAASMPVATSRKRSSSPSTRTSRPSASLRIVRPPSMRRDFSGGVSRNGC